MAQGNLLLTLRKLISGMDESLVIFDQDGQILYASYELLQLIGVESLEKNRYLISLWMNMELFPMN